MSVLKIGVVGYSGQKFDEEEAKRLLNEGFNAVLASYAGVSSVVVVSGLTDLGIPALAYRIAVENNWRTAGVACAKAENYDCFPVDERVIFGDNWGDESDAFLGMCGVIIRVGGGKQSLAEVERFKQSGGQVYEYELAALPS